MATTRTAIEDQVLAALRATVAESPGVEVISNPEGRDAPSLVGTARAAVVLTYMGARPGPVEEKFYGRWRYMDWIILILAREYRGGEQAALELLDLVSEALDGKEIQAGQVTAEGDARVPPGTIGKGITAYELLVTVASYFETEDI